jgi:hypothetical protein
MCPAVAVPVRAGFWWEVCFVVTVIVAAHILEDDFFYIRFEFMKFGN